MPTSTKPPRRTVARRMVRRPLAPAENAPPPSKRPLIQALVLGLCAVVLGGLAVWFAQKADEVRAAAGADNTALTDNATTSEAKGQVTSAINTLFSYHYDDLEKTHEAARRLLTGKAVCQYDQLFAVVKEQAPKQRLIVTLTVTNSGVELLTGDRARVLVFATQSDTSTTTKQTATAGAMFAVDAVRQNGAWLVSNIDTFSGETHTAACR